MIGRTKPKGIQYRGYVPYRLHIRVFALKSGLGLTRKLKPKRSPLMETSKLSKDPLFTEKVGDIVRCLAAIQITIDDKTFYGFRNPKFNHGGAHFIEASQLAAPPQ